MSEARLIRLQAITGLVFASFLVLHLANACVASFGAERFDAYLDFVRRYYQNPAVEVCVVGLAALVHLGIGVRRALVRRRVRRSADTPARAVPGWLRLHRLSGWFLALVIVGHVFATRGPGLIADMPAELSYLTFSLETWPWMMFPYYFLLFSCGAFHLVHGSVVALSAVGLRAGPPTRTWLRVALGLALVAGAAGVLGMRTADDVSRERYDDYRAFYERYMPPLATWK